MDIRAKSFLVDTFTYFSQLFRKFVKNTFIGTRAEWDALTSAEKAQYEIVNLTDDVAGGETIVTDAVTSGDLNPVTSNAVAEAIGDMLTTSDLTSSVTSGSTAPVTSGGVYSALNGVIVHGRIYATGTSCAIDVTSLNIRQYDAFLITVTGYGGSGTFMYVIQNNGANNLVTAITIREKPSTVTISGTWNSSNILKSIIITGTSGFNTVNYRIEKVG